MSYLSRLEVVDLLDVSMKSVENLLSVGLLGEPLRLGKTVGIPRDAAEALAARPYASDDLPPLLLVKVRGAEPPQDPSVDDRIWLGWNPKVDSQDPNQIEAVRKFWRVSEPERYLGERLVVSTAGFPLAVYRIKDITTHPGKLREFDIEADDSNTAQRVLAMRFPPTKGGAIELR